MLTKWTFACVLIIIAFSKIASPWTSYEKSYRGGCKVGADSKSLCVDLGEHAYKGYLLDEPPKGPKFYIDDLEPFNNEDYLQFVRNKRSSKRKENKKLQNDSNSRKEENIDNEDENDEMIEEKVEKHVKKKIEKKRGKKKKLEEKITKESEDDDEGEEDDTNEDETDDIDIGEEEKGKDKIKQ